MEHALTSALEAIALRGTQGLSASDFKHVPKLPSGAPLPSILHATLWRRVVQRSDDLRFRIPEQGAEEPSTSGRLLAPDAPEIATLAEAEANGVFIFPMLSLQDPAYGIYGRHLFKFSVSSVQQKVLQWLAEAGAQGLTQAELAIKSNMEGRNFGYVAKMLENRGLVSRRAAVLKKPPRGGVHGPGIQSVTTNIMHLARYAPEGLPRNARLTPWLPLQVHRSGLLLRSRQRGGAAASGVLDEDDESDDAKDAAGMFEEGEDDEDEHGDGDGDDEELGDDGKGGGAFHAGGTSGFLPNFVSEDSHFARITNYLSSQPDNVCMERKIKIALAYVGDTMGHRLWRRHKLELQDRGYVKFFQGRDARGKVSTYVKMLKPYTVGAESDAEEEEVDAEGAALAGLLDPFTRRLDIRGHQVAELSLDRQFLHLVASAGPEGVTSFSVERSLRINPKRHHNRFGEFTKWCARAAEGGTGTGTVKVTLGKQVMNKFVAPPSISHAIENAMYMPFGGVPVPPGGWVAGVMDAIAAGGLTVTGDAMDAAAEPEQQQQHLQQHLLQQEQLGGGGGGASSVPGDGGVHDPGAGLLDDLLQGGQGAGHDEARASSLPLHLQLPGVVPGAQRDSQHQDQDQHQHQGAGTLVDDGGHDNKASAGQMLSLATAEQLTGAEARRKRRIGGGRVDPAAASPLGSPRPGRSGVPGGAGGFAAADTASQAMPLNAAANDGGDADDEEDGAGNANKPKKRRVIVTEIGEMRRRWLVEAVNQQGMLLSAEVARMLQAKERATGKLNAVLPDMKVWQRAMKAAVADGEIETREVPVPVKAGSGGTRNAFVLFRPGMATDAAFVQRVIDRDRTIQSAMRKKEWNVHGAKGKSSRGIARRRPNAGDAFQAARGGDGGDRTNTAGYENNRSGGGVAAGERSGDDEMAVPLVPEPVYEIVPVHGPAAADRTQLGAHAAAQTNKTMMENGMLSSRLLRAKKLYLAMWNILEARNGAPPPTLDPVLFNGSEEGSAFVVTQLPARLDADGKDTAARSADGRDDGSAFAGSQGAEQQHARLVMKPLSATTESLALMVTYSEIWNNLTVDTFVQSIGSRCTNAPAVVRLRREGLTLGQLTKKQQRFLAGGIQGTVAAHQTLSRALALLHKMGLTGAVTPLGVGGGTVSKALQADNTAIVLLCPQIYIEEPPPAGSSTIPGAAAGGGGGAPTAAAETGQPSSAQPPAPAATPHSLTTAVPKLHVFDANVSDQREEYWHTLQLTAYRRVASPTLQQCFPFSHAPETASERSWAYKNTITAAEINAVRTALRGSASTIMAGGVPALATAGGNGRAPAGQLPGGKSAAAAAADAISTRAAIALARRLNVPFEAVVRVIAKEVGGRSEWAKPARLGGLGGRRQKRGSVGKAGRPATAGPASDEDASDVEIDDFGGFHLDGDDSFAGRRFAGAGAGGRPGASSTSVRIPTRKKKWFKEEDRQLLHAWVRWLAEHGAEKILKWRSVAERPPGTMAISCKNRLSSLRGHSSTAPMMMRIKELAAGVHSRRVLQQSVPIGAFRPAADHAPPALTGAVGSKRAASEVAAHGSSSPSSPKAPSPKRPRIDPAIKTLPANPDGSLPFLFQTYNDDDETALNEVIKTIESVVAVAPNRYKGGRNDRVEAAVQRGARFGGGVGGLGSVAFAGGRGELRLSSGSNRVYAALRQRARATAAARASGAVPPAARVAAAMELIRALLFVRAKIENGGGDGGGGDIEDDGSVVAALPSRFSEEELKVALHELLRRGHISLRVPGSSDHRVPADREQTHHTGATVALTKRFYAELDPLFLPNGVFSEAQGFADRQNATSAAPSTTTSVFKTRLLPTQPHAHHHHHHHHQDRPPITGGTVAILLSRIAASCADVRATLPQSILFQGLPSPGAMTTTTTSAAAGAIGAALAEDAAAEVEERVATALAQLKISATFTTAPSADDTNRPSSSSGRAVSGEAGVGVGTTGGGGNAKTAQAFVVFDGNAPTLGDGNGNTVSTPAAVASPMRLSLPIRERESASVLYQPALVGVDAALRNAATLAARKAFASLKLPGGTKGADALLQALKTAGKRGLNFAGVQNALLAYSRTHRNRNAVDVDAAARFLCRHGLARCLPAYDDVVLVASEHSASGVTFPFAPSSPSRNPQAAENAVTATAVRATTDGSSFHGVEAVRNALAPLKLPPPGSEQPLAEVPIRPWVDHQGRLLKELWRGLMHRAIAVVQHFPGVNGEVLVQALRAVNPAHAREVLTVLCAAGVLSAERVGEVVSGGVPSSVLDACFKDDFETAENGGGEEEGGEVYGGPRILAVDWAREDAEWRYFVDTSKCWEVDEIVPPHVLFE